MKYRKIILLVVDHHNISFAIVLNYKSAKTTHSGEINIIITFIKTHL